VFTLPANQYGARGAYLFNYSEVESFANGTSTSGVAILLYMSFATSFYETFKYLLNESSAVSDYAGQHITMYKASLWSPATIRYEMQAGGSQNASAFAVEQAQLPLERSSPDQRASYAVSLLTRARGLLDGSLYLPFMSVSAGLHCQVRYSLRRFSRLWRRSEHVGDSVTVIC